MFDGWNELLNLRTLIFSDMFFQIWQCQHTLRDKYVLTDGNIMYQ